ncbi:UNVERIFIED_CONTAM: hypothetical protein Sradi_0703100 [Sesamum radiatum]|uniref:TetR family transcriptional regulator n=1 Tax=Sesamum radiatum TaxID=300843 RepID=A0AAW2VQP4_SESRA
MDPVGNDEEVRVAAEILVEWIASVFLGGSTPNASVLDLTIQQAIQAPDSVGPRE